MKPKSYNVVAQGVYKKYLEHLLEYMSYREDFRIGHEFGSGVPNVRFMREFEEKIICIVEVEYLRKEDIPPGFTISDKARKYILNLVTKSGCDMSPQYYDNWNDVLAIQQCVDNYIEKHPELIREHRLITDTWEPSGLS